MQTKLIYLFIGKITTMAKLLLPLLFVCFCAISCSNPKIPEGEILYTITYPHTELTSFMELVLPEEMTVTFKGTEVRSKISRGNIFQTEVISNEEDESVEMRLDFGGKKYFCSLDKAEVEKLKQSQPNYTVKSTGSERNLGKRIYRRLR